MQLSVYPGKSPKCVLLPRNCRCRVKRRRCLLAAYAWDQCAGKKIPRRSKKARYAHVLGLQWPGIIAARTIDGKRCSASASAKKAGQICIEEMIFAKKDSAAKVARQCSRVHRQYLPCDPAPVFELIIRDLILTEHQHSSRITFDDGEVEDRIRARNQMSGAQSQWWRILRARGRSGSGSGNHDYHRLIHSLSDFRDPNI